MRLKKFFVLLILIFSLKNVFSQSENFISPFELSLPVDAVLLSAGAGIFSASYIFPHVFDLENIEHEESHNPKNVNPFDRWSIHEFQSGVNIAGGVTCGMCISMPFLICGVNLIHKDFPYSELVTLSVMYAESFLMSHGICNLLKTSIQRPRPYTYVDGSNDNSSLIAGDSHLSFPSAHTSNAFLSAGFLTYVYSNYFPESKYKIPIITFAYATAAGTGALRIASANHFLSDVLTGAAIGTVFGYGIPMIHKKMAEHNSALQIMPAPAGVNFRYTF